MRQTFRQTIQTYNQPIQRKHVAECLRRLADTLDKWPFVPDQEQWPTPSEFDKPFDTFEIQLFVDYDIECPRLTTTLFHYKP